MLDITECQQSTADVVGQTTKETGTLETGLGNANLDVRMLDHEVVNVYKECTPRTLTYTGQTNLLQLTNLLFKQEVMRIGFDYLIVNYACLWRGGTRFDLVHELLETTDQGHKIGIDDRSKHGKC